MRIKHLIVIIACLTYFDVHSQSENSSDALEGLNLEDLFNVEITIASKTEETIIDAPSSVTVFTRQEIENMGVTSVSELLNYVPGFQSSRVLIDGPRDAIQIRGRTTGTNSYDVLILIDGQRINDAHSGGPNAFSTLRTLGHVKQVEVIRGPGSALYGSNAFLGVVNIITTQEIREASITWGDTDLWRADINYADSIGDVDYSVYASVFDDQGFDYDFNIPGFPDFNETHDSVEGSDVYLNLDYKRLNVKSRYQERRQEDFINFDSISDDLTFNKTWEASVKATLELVDQENLSLVGSVEYIRHRWRSIGLIIPAGVDTGFGPLPENFYAGPVYWNTDTTGTLDADIRLNDRHQLIAGVFFRKSDNERLRGLSNYDSLVPIPPFLLPGFEIVTTDDLNNAERKRDIWGGYIQDKITFSDEVTAFIGARFDRYEEEDRTYNSFNPRGGLIYTPSDSSSLKLLYGTAFRAPSLAELYLSAPTVVANPDLEAEDAQTIEIVYLQDLQDRGRLAITLFTNDIDDAVTRVTDPNDPAGRVRSENRGTAEFRGAEIEFSYLFNPDFLFKASYTSIFDSKRTIDDMVVKDPSDNAFENLGSIILNYAYDRWNFNLNGVFRSEIDDFPQQSSYFLGNFKTRYNATPRMWLELTAKNVFDEDYLTFSESTLLLNQSAPNRGREFLATVRFEL